MGLLDLFLLLLMSEHQLLVLHVVLLLLQLGDPILGHFSLYNIVTKSNMSQAHTRKLDAKKRVDCTILDSENSIEITDLSGSSIKSSVALTDVAIFLFASDPMLLHSSSKRKEHS